VTISKSFSKERQSRCPSKNYSASESLREGLHIETPHILGENIETVCASPLAPVPGIDCGSLAGRPALSPKALSIAHQHQTQEQTVTTFSQAAEKPLTLHFDNRLTHAPNSL
jgi:hypothetical protein